MLKQRIRIFIFIILLAFSMTPRSEAGEEMAIDTAENKYVYLIKGELEALKVFSLTRVSLTNPGVADIVNVSDEEILLIAKTVGQTVLFIWDEQGKRDIIIRVFSRNLDLVKERIEQLLLTVGVEGITLSINEKEGKIVVSGDIPADKKDDVSRVLEPFKDDLLDLSKKQEIKDLVQIDMLITELGTNSLRKLGVDWTAGSGDGISIDYPETQPSTDGSIGDYFKIGEFNRATALTFTINALIEKGEGRVLSRPKLVVVSGQSASFNVGGEIPITSVTTTNSGTVQNIEFKSYGVGLSVTPTIVSGKVDIDLKINVSDVDPATAVGGDNIAFVSSTASTKLFLEDRQTIVLAGLIKQAEAETTRKVPYLGDVPILGMLFRSKFNPVANQDTELVISLTPTVIPQRKSLLAQETMLSPDPIVENHKDIGLEKMDLNKEDVMMEEGAFLLEEDDAILQEDQLNDFFEDDEVLAPVERMYQRPMDVSVKKDSFARIPGVPLEMTGYVRAVQQKISSSIIYPREAKEYGWEGTVRLGLIILNDGTLAQVLIKESSGYKVFDEYALSTARESAPYAKFPAGTELQEISVTIPIIYSLNN